MRGEGGTIVTITPVPTTVTGTYTCNIADNRINQSLAFTLEVMSSLQEDDLSKSGADRTLLRSMQKSSSIVLALDFMKHQ